MLSEQVGAGMTRERVLAALSGFFGGLALLLAVIGLYGTLDYLGTQRRAEFAVRIALGATPGLIVRLVMVDVLALLAVGIPAGIGLSLATTQFLRSLLFGIRPARGPTGDSSGCHGRPPSRLTGLHIFVPCTRLRQFSFADSL